MGAICLCVCDCSYLASLVELNHVLLRALHSFAASKQRIIVKRKKRVFHEDRYENEEEMLEKQLAQVKENAAADLDAHLSPNGNGTDKLGEDGCGADNAAAADDDDDSGDDQESVAYVDNEFNLEKFEMVCLHCVALLLMRAHAW